MISSSAWLVGLVIIPAFVFAFALPVLWSCHYWGFFLQQANNLKVRLAVLQGPDEYIFAFAAADKEGIVHCSSHTGSNDRHDYIGVVFAANVADKPGDLLHIGYDFFLTDTREAAKARVLISLHERMTEDYFHGATLGGIGEVGWQLFPRYGVIL